MTPLRCTPSFLSLVATLLVLMGFVGPAPAHNGAVAIAVPVEGITVDGDLSDWPEDMRRYSISLSAFGAEPTDLGDYQGVFRIGYNQQEAALYVAVEVQDDSVVIDSTATAALNAPDASQASDGCEVFLEVGHKQGEGQPAQWVIWANTRRSFGAATATSARV